MLAQCRSRNSENTVTIVSLIRTQSAFSIAPVPFVNNGNHATIRDCAITIRDCAISISSRCLEIFSTIAAHLKPRTYQYSKNCLWNRELYIPYHVHIKACRAVLLAYRICSSTQNSTVLCDRTLIESCATIGDRVSLLHTFSMPLYHWRPVLLLENMLIPQVVC